MIHNKYSYIMEKYGLIIHYPNDASYYFHTNWNEFLDLCDRARPEIWSVLYNKVFKRTIWYCKQMDQKSALSYVPQFTLLTWGLQKYFWISARNINGVLDTQVQVPLASQRAPPSYLTECQTHSSQTRRSSKTNAQNVEMFPLVDWWFHNIIHRNMNCCGDNKNSWFAAGLQLI